MGNTRLLGIRNSGPSSLNFDQCDRHEKEEGREGGGIHPAQFFTSSALNDLTHPEGARKTFCRCPGPKISRTPHLRFLAVC